jgi:hypothetical protein
MMIEMIVEEVALEKDIIEGVEREEVQGEGAEREDEVEMMMIMIEDIDGIDVWLCFECINCLCS